MTNHPIQPHKMSCSPTPNSHFIIPEPSNNCDITSSFETTQPEMCCCENQLGHWDWSGVPHEDLPELCKQYMDITSVIESDPDQEWPRGKINIFKIV